MLAELVAAGVIPEAAHPCLRVAAMRFWRGMDGVPQDAVIQILAHIGPPSDLAESLLAVACDGLHSKATRAASARALAHISGRDGRVLDSSMLFDMKSACAASDLTRFARIAAVGIARALPAAFELTERVLAELGPARPDDLQVIIALADCVEGLASAGRMSDASLREALDRPGTYLCAVAARHALGRALETSEVQALFALLAGDDPVCAAEAALTLLSGGAISPRDAELFDVATRALPAQRAELVHAMQARGASWSHLWPLLDSLLSSTDSTVHDVLRRMAPRFTSEGLPEKLRPLLPRVVDPGLRRYIENILAWTSRARARYWKDSASR